MIAVFNRRFKNFLKSAKEMESLVGEEEEVHFKALSEFAKVFQLGQESKKKPTKLMAIFENMFRKNSAAILRKPGDGRWIEDNLVLQISFADVEDLEKRRKLEKTYRLNLSHLYNLAVDIRNSENATDADKVRPHVIILVFLCIFNAISPDSKESLAPHIRYYEDILNVPDDKRTVARAPITSSIAPQLSSAANSVINVIRQLGIQVPDTEIKTESIDGIFSSLKDNPDIKNIASGFVNSLSNGGQGMDQVLNGAVQTINSKFPNLAEQARNMGLVPNGQSSAAPSGELAEVEER